MNEIPQGPAYERLREIVEQVAQGDFSTKVALGSLVSAAHRDGGATLDEIAIRYRDFYLLALREEGRDPSQEAGRLGLDEVRAHLASSVLPRLASQGFIVLPQLGLMSPDARVRIADRYWEVIGPLKAEVVEKIRHTAEHQAVLPDGRRPAKRPGAPSVLQADGLVKMYRRRRVVNDVALRLQQGEIVGLLGPNGAGKTTTFYMIVGLIQPLSGRILLDGEDITGMPMFRRARRGVGYLSQEPSIFRKLSVEDNILAILETLPLSPAERSSRLERLLDELSIKHLRHSKAYALSGGERRRLEITRALVTEPKFMMLDEPFAGVDPIAVHDIQTIVAGLRHRGIGVLISDHNVEQTLDIVDRAYIMFDGQVKVSGTVRQLVFDDTVAQIYLGPTLAARLRARFSETDGGAP
ncbi:MAG TPA: LPS export ABC transporter ATP-binding protein [Gemmatimonadaceae bacterium]